MKYPAAAVVGLTLVGAGVWVTIGHSHRHPVPSPMVYTAAGYGGYLPAPIAQRAARKPALTAGPKAVSPKAFDPKAQSEAAPKAPEQAAREAYAAGRYGDVETAAAQVIREASQNPTLPRRKAAARAGNLLAYAAARRHDLKLARSRFASAQEEAAALPDKGRFPELLGQPDQANLEEDAAFQHAVCTGALGDQTAAEAEYVAFMHRFPESPLVQASVKRIARIHGGNIPPADEAVWHQAMQTSKLRQTAQQREASLCGPECLVELLRRRGAAASVHGLAREMATTEHGTSLASLAAVAGRHGFRPRGLSLTQKGLTEQRLPVIALISPGHYVLVEVATPTGVTVWDPDAAGVGHGDRRFLPLADWQRQWRGLTLALTSAKTEFAQTASR